MKKSKKKQDKTSLIVLIVGLIIVMLVVINLENINNLILNKNTNEEKEEVEEKEQTPMRYQCFYGPAVDTFYNYIKSEYVVFNFDENGNVTNVTSEEKYQVTTINDYNYMLSVLSINSSNVSYDPTNYIVTVLDNDNDKFPDNYKSLNKYLSDNHYTCSKE